MIALALFVLTACLGPEPTPELSPAPAANEAPAADPGPGPTLFDAGNARFEARDYVGALIAWNQALSELPAGPEHEPTRALLVANIAAASQGAYLATSNPAYLDHALRVIDARRAALAAAPAPSAELADLDGRREQLASLQRESQARGETLQPTPQGAVFPAPVPAAPAPPPAPQAVPVGPVSPTTNPGLMARGIKETVMGGVFLGLGAPLIAVGVPLIISGAELERQDDPSSKGSLRIAGGAVATAFGGMFTLFGVVLLPTGISKMVRARRGGFGFNRTPRGTWTAGVHFQF